MLIKPAVDVACISFLKEDDALMTLGKGREGEGGGRTGINGAEIHQGVH